MRMQSNALWRNPAIDQIFTDVLTWDDEPSNLSKNAPFSHQKNGTRIKTTQQQAVAIATVPDGMPKIFFRTECANFAVSEEPGHRAPEAHIMHHLNNGHLAHPCHIIDRRGDQWIDAMDENKIRLELLNQILYVTPCFHGINGIHKKPDFHQQPEPFHLIIMALIERNLMTTLAKHFHVVLNDRIVATELLVEVVNKKDFHSNRPLSKPI